MKKIIRIVSIIILIVMLPVFALAETDNTAEDESLVIHPTIEEYYDANAIPPPVTPVYEDEEETENTELTNKAEFPETQEMLLEEINNKEGFTEKQAETVDINAESTENQEEQTIAYTKFPELIENESQQTLVEDSQSTKAVATQTDLGEVHNPKKKYAHDEEFGVLYGNTIVKLGDDPESAIEELEKQQGNDYEVDAVRTTIYTPEYKSYECENIAIMTDDNNHEFEEIKAIFVDTKGIYTRRNIQVGDSLERVKKRYGYNYKSLNDTILYIKMFHGNEHYILFQIDDNDTVLSYAILDECPSSYKNK